MADGVQTFGGAEASQVQYFLRLMLAVQNAEFEPFLLGKDVLSELGKRPSKKVGGVAISVIWAILTTRNVQAIVVSISSIESSFAYHASKGS